MLRSQPKAQKTAVKIAAQNPTLLYWLAGNLAAGIVALLPNPIAPYAGAATAGAVNTGFYISSAAKKRIAAAERADKLDRSKFAAEMARLDEDKAAISQAQREVDKQNAQLMAVESSLATQQRTMKDRMLVEAQREAQTKVDVMQERLDKALQDKAAMQATYQEKQTTMAKNTGLIVSKVEQSRRDLGDQAAQTIATGNEVLAKERQQVNGVLQNLERDIKAMASELAAHKELVAQLQGPKHFNQSSLEGQIGNRIISFLIGRKVMVSAHRIGETKYGEVSFYVMPINCDLKEIADLLEPMQLHTHLNELPTASIESNGSIKITVRINSEKRPKASVIKRVSESKLKQAFLDIKFGLRFTGYTGRGKSTLLNNVIELYESELNTRFTIFDPKVDFPTAKYPKNVVYRGLSKCVSNIDMIGETCKARQDYKVLNDEQGVTIPAQHLQPKLFLIDECKDIHDAAALADMDEKPADRVSVKNFRFSIQKGLEVGRGLGLRVVYSTVTPDSSDFGFKNSVFKQSATVFLGDQCYEALGTKSQYLTTVSDTKKAQLRQEYDARVSSDDERDNFIGLFFNGLTNEIFFFSPPAPDAWKTQFSKPAVEGVAQPLAQQPQNAETATPQVAQSSPAFSPEQPSLESSPALGQNSPATGPLILSLAELVEAGSDCPDCNAHTTSFKSKQPRKSDNTVRMRCKTKGCPSGGEFRVKVSD